MPRPAADLDLLSADAKTLSSLLQQGDLTSTSLVDMYLDMIEKHDGYLHAMLSIVPCLKLQAVAQKLDKGRKEGKLRGRLHGILIIMKVRDAY